MDRAGAVTGEWEKLLKAATVALTVPGPRGVPIAGTGFFVAPYLVVTCAHVLADGPSEIPPVVNGQITATGAQFVLEPVPELYFRDSVVGLDLAFLRTS